MVGLGTQDGLARATSFLERHEISAVQLLWDRTGLSWAKLRVPTQPAWMLVAADGTVVRRALGAIAYSDVLRRI